MSSWEKWREMDIDALGIRIDGPRRFIEGDKKAAESLTAGDEDIIGIADPRSEALGIIERMDMAGADNEALADALRPLGFMAIGGKLVPITNESPQVTPSNITASPPLTVPTNDGV